MAEPRLDLVHEHDEAHDGSVAGRLNWLRAAVLGANDGIVSTAGLVIGVAAATTERAAVFTAGLAGLAAGAMSMAVGEYVSVSTQRDTEKALIAKEIRELARSPRPSSPSWPASTRPRGCRRTWRSRWRAADRPRRARRARRGRARHRPAQLHQPVARGVGLDGGLHRRRASLPLLAIVLPPLGWRVPVTVVAVVVALAFTGWLSARLGSSDARRATVRVVVGGLLAMAVTYGIGALVGTQVG